MFAADLEVLSLLGLQGKGLRWGTEEVQGLLGSSARFSTTVTNMVLGLD